MEKYRAPVIATLASQLLRGPRRLRLKQLFSIEFLLSVTEARKEYPFDFVLHALTGFRSPNGGDARLIDGEMLIGDLVTLAEELSEDGDIRQDSFDEPVWSVADLAKRFDVSTKTIFRWRRRGLAGWKLRYPDRRMRVVFADRCVRRFVAQNADLVQRGSTFSQLSADERTRIVSRAQELVASGQRTVNAVARVVAGEVGRAVETIRLILKNYDDAHPRAGIFNRSTLQVAPDDQRLAVWEAYVEGATIESLSERFGRPVTWIYRTITQMRARDLKVRKIDFIDSPEFVAADAETTILNDPAALAGVAAAATPERRIPAELPPYLQQLFRYPLLTAAREQALFRKMNYLKFCAARLVESLEADSARPADLDRIDDLLEQAGRIKNEITQANLRLVVSIAKKHVSIGNEFFELISDGNVSLMRAVDKFDYTRGFKFSTYASWAVMKNFARSIPEQRTLRDRYQTGRDEMFEGVVGMPTDDGENEHLSAIRSTLERMLEMLDPRERSILRQRYGLDDGGAAQTLEQVGRKFGVSKERVRQLEARAMAKLRGEFEPAAKKLLAS